MLVNIDGKKVTIEKGLDGETVYACYDEVIYTAVLNYADVIYGCTPVVETIAFEGASREDCKRQIAYFKEGVHPNRKYLNIIWDKRKERKRFDITLDIRIAIGK